MSFMDASMGTAGKLLCSCSVDSRRLPEGNQHAAVWALGDSTALRCSRWSYRSFTKQCFTSLGCGSGEERTGAGDYAQLLVWMDRRFREPPVLPKLRLIRCERRDDGDALTRRGARSLRRPLR